MDDLSLIRADESSLNQDSIDRLQLSLSKRYNQSVFFDASEYRAIKASYIRE